MKYQGMTALVTGASAGLGEEFASQLARQGANLVLVARSGDRLKRLAAVLQQQSTVEVTVLPANLSSAECGECKESWTQDRPFDQQRSHEILNETIKDEVLGDVVSFLHRLSPEI